uniref:Uncharacterized protein n=1 Tax=Steinernema glaseri TaxID=37863 RepID=A0A1I7ZII7_9BILA
MVKFKGYLVILHHRSVFLDDSPALFIFLHDVLTVKARTQKLVKDLAIQRSKYVTVSSLTSLQNPLAFCSAVHHNKQTDLPFLTRSRVTPSFVPGKQSSFFPGVHQFDVTRFIRELNSVPMQKSMMIDHALASPCIHHFDDEKRTKRNPFEQFPEFTPCEANWKDLISGHDL